MVEEIQTIISKATTKIIPWHCFALYIACFLAKVIIFTKIMIAPYPLGAMYDMAHPLRGRAKSEKQKQSGFCANSSGL